MSDIIYLMSYKQFLNQSDINVLSLLINKWSLEAPQIWGKRIQVSNFHQFNHIIDDIKNNNMLAPFYFSSFYVESFMGHLKKFTHGTKASIEQLARNFNSYTIHTEKRLSLNSIEKKFDISTNSTIKGYYFTFYFSHWKYFCLEKSINLL